MVSEELIEAISLMKGSGNSSLDYEIDFVLDLIKFSNRIGLNPGFKVVEMPEIDLTGQPEFRLIHGSEDKAQSLWQEIDFMGKTLRLWPKDIIVQNLDGFIESDISFGSLISEDFKHICNCLISLKSSSEIKMDTDIELSLKLIYLAEKFNFYSGMKYYFLPNFNNSKQEIYKVVNDGESDRKCNWEEIKIDQDFDLKAGDIILTKGNRENP